MKTIQLNLYSFNELDVDARKKTIERYRDINLLDEWWDAVFEDFVNLAGFFGIAVDKDTINFQGFYFQGNGSGFSADVDLKALTESIGGEKWKEYAPQLDFKFKLPDIDRRALALAVQGKIDLQARIIRKRKAYEVIADLGGYPVNASKNHDLIYGEMDALEKWLENIGQTLNRYLFKSLEDEYDRLSGDEAISETLTANGYLFTSDGASAERLNKLAL